MSCPGMFHVTVQHNLEVSTEDQSKNKIGIFGKI